VDLPEYYVYFGRYWLNCSYLDTCLLCVDWVMHLSVGVVGIYVDGMFTLGV
jgi:hypothetical protein